MPGTIAEKLRIREGDTLLTLHAPANFKEGLHGLPKRTAIREKASDYQQIHWFVTTRAQLEKEMSRVMKLLRPGVLVWVYYPKGSSGMQTDLTRDKGWECLMKEDDKLAWINLISFDDTWSAFGFRAKTEADRKRDAQPKKEREIFKWIDPVKKTVKIPEELKKAFTKNRKEAAYFDSLAFSHRKEYVEWIVEAKKEETREKRVAGTIERLRNQWKNPRNV
jgi:hypothetical protein